MLINCRECDERVSDSAPTYPKCGIVNPAGRACKITLSRRKTLNSASMFVKLYLNNDLIGPIRNGETFAIDIPLGEHELVAEFISPLGPSWERRIVFDVEYGQTASFECGFKGMKGSYLK